jgi:hypothetical protein
VFSLARAAAPIYRALSAAFRPGTYAAVCAVTCFGLAGAFSSGCGIVGRELKPRELVDGALDEDAGDDLDVGSDDADANTLDATDQDASADVSVDAPNDVDTTAVDGCVLSGAGGCRKCDPLTFKATTCGIGYCNASSQCLGGVELACVPGMPRAADDTTCDGVDDNCSGSADEDFSGATTNCGSGACAASGVLMCMSGAALDTCAPPPPMTSADDATGTGNGIDDDCDGSIDEDVSPCDSTPRLFEAGAYASIPVPPGCGRATVQLWGGAGAAGGQAGIGDVERGGRGGSGGYARSTLALTGPLSLYIGTGGAVGCGAAGTNQGGTAYGGGRAAFLGPGAPGADGVVRGGGAGANNIFGEDGGDGYYGGGGGGASSLDPVNGFSSGGGGGGAASVALLNGALSMVAGGGGGGGGAVALVYNFGASGGNGGEGCSGAGSAGANARTGGGGGGGVCIGMITSVGTNGRPANAPALFGQRARGTNESCLAGGNGYGIVTFSR